MSKYRPTRGRGNNSRTRGRSSPARRDMTSTRDETNLRDELNSEDELIGLGNSDDDTEEDSSPVEENDRRVRRRGPNQGTPIPSSPGRRRNIVIRTLQDFNTPLSTREIACIVKGFTFGRYKSYGLVPDHLHENMFRAFGEKFKWPDHTDFEVEKIFRKIAGRHLRDSFCYVRKVAMNKSHSNNPLDWKNYKPTWIHEEEWVKRLEEWSDEEWQKISQINSKNHAVQVQPKHTAGSVPFVVVEDRMSEDLQRSPTPLELFERTHRKPSGDFIDERSKATFENYHKAVEEIWPIPAQRPPFDPNIWTKVTNGIRKGHVYGLGSSQCAAEVRNCSGKSRLRSQSIEIEELKKKLAEAEDRRHKEIEDLRVSMEAKMDAKIESLLPEKIRDLLREINLPNSVFPSSSGSRNE